MNSIKRYYPSFVDMRNPEGAVRFTTTEELLAIPFVKSWSEEKGFSHFALSADCLMAILDGGKGWWVIGRLTDPSMVDLPKWIEKFPDKYCVTQPDGDCISTDPRCMHQQKKNHG